MLQIIDGSANIISKVGAGAATTHGRLHGVQVSGVQHSHLTLLASFLGLGANTSIRFEAVAQFTSLSDLAQHVNSYVDTHDDLDPPYFAAATNTPVTSSTIGTGESFPAVAPVGSEVLTVWDVYYHDPASSNDFSTSGSAVGRMFRRVDAAAKTMVEVWYVDAAASPMPRPEQGSMVLVHRASDLFGRTGAGTQTFDVLVESFNFAQI